MNKIKKLLAEYRANCKEKQEQELRERFRVEERGGSLWLTVDGVAVRQIEKGMDAATIYGLLADARIAAVTYHNIKCR